MIYTKIIKYIGLIFLVLTTFYATEKIIDVSIEQDEIMQTLKIKASEYEIKPIDAIIKDDTIIPGKTGKTIELNKSYKNMRKIGTYQESLIEYTTTYPTISIYNNYNLYITNGNPYKKNITLIYILTSYNSSLLDGLLNISKKTSTPITFFIDTTFLSKNIDILNKLNNYEIYNYGTLGKYTKDNLIITNNIINNKTNNQSTYCLFLRKDTTSLNNCANFKMHSIIPKLQDSILTDLANGAIYVINNTKNISSLIDYIKGKGYNIIPLSKNIVE